ncbi:tripartite tricarboxylate transporter TctB family protein [Acuticoccus sp. MNP-M23]|uniref:tripartite tricarboxylate transporter TctB family protein n=1 Tax=Acuticoccus sp. MNP-M23 TaxID=3072793 RepID=UPI002814EA8C|nr:tripartite tricarboxylate transporter TctB family protein [Acuticoccus sp. MNP-M23]WMS44654.1 tripartite tricarboxylate transporter TctB family protein [Acuticoccus sp. MNP-M23]
MRAPVKRGDLVLGLVFAGLGGAIVMEAAGLPKMGNVGVGSGLFPTITGAGMVVFGLVLAIGAVFAVPMPGKAIPRPKMLRWDVVAVLVLLAAMVLLLPVAGFLVAGAVFATGVARLGGAPWIGALLFGVIATLLLYTVFVHALGVPLPRGLLAF